MLKEFKGFILRGSAIDLAVGVVIGAAFGAVVNSIVSNLLTPLTTIWRTCTPAPGATPGEPARSVPTCENFANLRFQLGESVFQYGRVLNDIISLALIGAAVFFFVVRPLNKLEERRRREEPEPLPTTRPCPECLSEIPNEARRCKFCASEVTPVA